jgi:hypothetical protein
MKLGTFDLRWRFVVVWEETRSIKGLPGVFGLFSATFFGVWQDALVSPPLLRLRGVLD